MISLRGILFAVYMFLWKILEVFGLARENIRKLSSTVLPSLFDFHHSQPLQSVHSNHMGQGWVS